MKMDKKDVPTLLDLAAKSLISNEPAAIQALELLPKHFFIPLFTAAFLGRKKMILKNLVRVCPFYCLHVGAFNIQEPSYDILEAMLDGLKFLPAQNSSSGGSKLRILDLRQTQNCGITCYYRPKYPFYFHSCVYSQHSTLKEEEEKHRIRAHGTVTSENESVAARKPIELLVDLSFNSTLTTNRFISFLKSKIEQSFGSLHLCCRNLQIYNISEHKSSLQILDLACINCLEVNWAHLRKVTMHLPQLIHLNILRLTKVPFHSRNKRNFKTFLTWLKKMNVLQELSLSFFCLTDLLHKVLRVLQPQLDTLSLSFCELSNRDLIVLSRSSQLTCLKRLNLSNNHIFLEGSEPFLTLLKRVSGTLQHLEINNCQITDSALSAIIPALSRCSQLCVFSFAINPITLSALINILEHLTALIKLRGVIYPVPVHCYEQLNFRGSLDQQKLFAVQAQLNFMLQVANRGNMNLTTIIE